jgi:hypothetical protein
VCQRRVALDGGGQRGQEWSRRLQAERPAIVLVTPCLDDLLSCGTIAYGLAYAQDVARYSAVSNVHTRSDVLQQFGLRDQTIVLLYQRQQHLLRFGLQGKHYTSLA